MADKQKRRKISVSTASRSYKMLIGRGISDDAEGILVELFPGSRKIFFITNNKVFDIHGKKIIKKIEKSCNIKTLVLPDGEEYKSNSTLSKIYDFFMKNHAHRDDVVIAFGGGVIGDTAGFAAATFNRGLELVQYPTTIISQVDSSIGGKAAINFRGVKNIIGCFYQPHLIICDPDLLNTLEEKELINGLGEIIKYGLVFDYKIIESIKEILNENPESEERLKNMITDERFDEIIFKCSKIKSDIVEKDEFDTGIRNYLNFGHTIGHAIEKVLGFKNISHGQAVSLGILCSIDISISLGFIKDSYKKELLNLYKLLKLPVRISSENADAIVKAIHFDKKITEGRTKFIILKKINDAIVINGIDETVIKKSIIKNT